MSRLRSKFASYNKDGDKFLDFNELSRLLLKGNPSMTDEELRICFHSVDKNHDGKISFDEFVDWSFSKTGERRQPSAMKEPERFFYDQSSYTGVHTHGGPSTIDANNSLSNLCRPGLRGSSGAHHAVHHEDAVQHRYVEDDPPPRHHASESHGNTGGQPRGPERF